MEIPVLGSVPPVDNFPRTGDDTQSPRVGDEDSDLPVPES